VHRLTGAAAVADQQARVLEQAAVERQRQR
jgi:hypothetical protein